MRIEEIKIDTFGGSPIAEHNYPCPVHHDEHAVYMLSEGYFQPSWKAQKEGWRLVKADSWWKRLLAGIIDHKNGKGEE